MHLTPKGEHEEFTIIRVNLNTTRNNSVEHPYNKDDLYLKFNNAEYNNII